MKPLRPSSVPAGYQQTEVGVIPDDWSLDYIENVAHITTGNKNTQDRIDDGQYPFFVRSQTIERINSYSFDGEAVLTAGDGVGTGKVFHYINGKFDAHQRVYRMSDFSERINGFYFFLYFSTHFYSRIMQMTAKSSVDSVRREMIARMMVPLPPTKIEQDAIATALSDMDGLLGALERLIAKKRDLKQAAMQQLLTGQTRLPGFSGPWVQKAIHQIAEVGRGRVISHVEISKSTNPLYPVYSSQTSNNGVMGYIDSNDFEGNYVTWTTDGANAGTVFARSGKFNCTNVCGTIKLHDSDHRFIAAALGQVTQPHVSRHLGNPKLMNDIMKKIELRLPPTKAEQTAIAAVLSEQDGELAVLEQRREKTRALKQAMMQELLTGRTRLV